MASATRPKSPRTIRSFRSPTTTNTRACASRCSASISRPISSATIIRPATVCGYSPRMRFDLTVNILTNHAVHKGRHHGVRRRAETAEHPHRGHHRSLRAAASSTRRKRSRARRSMPATKITPSRSWPSSCARSSRRSFPEKAPIACRDDHVERQPLLSRFVAQDRGEARLDAEAHHRGCRPRLVPRVQGGQVPDSMTERQLRERQHRQSARPEMSAPA